MTQDSRPPHSEERTELNTTSNVAITDEYRQDELYQRQEILIARAYRPKILRNGDIVRVSYGGKNILARLGSRGIRGKKIAAWSRAVTDLGLIPGQETCVHIVLCDEGEHEKWLGNLPDPIVRASARVNLDTRDLVDNAKKELSALQSEAKSEFQAARKERDVAANYRRWAIFLGAGGFVLGLIAEHFLIYLFRETLKLTANLL